MMMIPIQYCFFSTTGKFLKKITDRSINAHIFFDQWAGIIRVAFDNGIGGVKNKFYSLTGKLVSEKEGRSIDNALRMTDLGNGYYAVSKNCTLSIQDLESKDSTLYPISIYKDGILYKQLLPWNTFNNRSYFIFSSYIPPPEMAEQGAIYVSSPFDYIVYKVNKDSAKEAFRFIFPNDRSISERFLTDKNVRSLKSMEKDIKKDGKKVIRVTNGFSLNDHLFFKIEPPFIRFAAGSESFNNYNYIYNRAAQKLISVERISPDKRNYYLPFFDQDFKTRGFRNHNGYLYTTVSSLKIFSEMQVNKHKHPSYPSTLQNYFNTQNKKSNLIIVQLKFKPMYN